MLGYKTHRTKLGEFAYVINKNSLVALKLPTENLVTFLDRIKKFDTNVSLDPKNQLLGKISNEMDLYLSGKLKKFTIPLDLSYCATSAFQQLVWQEIAKIEYGKTVTYKTIAETLENKKAFQAVGTATGKNPIPVIVGCHRVLGSNNIGGFSGGLELKKKLLNIEMKYKKTKLQDFI